MNKLDKQYTELLQDILDNGVTKQDRTGTGTISVFGRQIRHNMKDGFPLLTTKRMSFKTIVTELLWFLRGDTNIKYLVDNNCHIWDGDCYKSYATSHIKEVRKQQRSMREKGWETVTLDPNYLSQEQFINKIKTDDEFAKKWGELGPIYGKQWRSWRYFAKAKGGYNSRDYHGQIDQIQNLINDLKTDPDSRRLMVNAWNVGELDQMVLPPCHYGFQVYTRELSIDERNDLLYKKIGGNHKRENCFSDEEFERETLQDCKAFDIPTRAISLMWNQRSVDTFLGLPFNIASYGLLLEIIAKEVNMVPDQLIGNLGDVHLYSNHIEQAKEQIGRKYTHEERTELLKQAMGKERYDKAVNELMPFGGGLSGYYDSYKIPNRTREPFPLPTFDCPAIDEIPHTTFDELVFKLQPCDFYMDDYQSHPAIKAPLSN
jgi:thymidylate synthase